MSARIIGSGPFTLALTPFGTEIGGVPPSDSAETAVAAIQESFASHPDSTFSVVIVVPPGRDAVFSAFQSAVSIAFSGSPRVSVISGNIAALRSQHGRDCQVIACETTWRYKLNVSVATKLVASLAGPRFEASVGELSVPGAPGSAEMVALNPSCELATAEGAQFVALAITPNFSNASKPDCLVAAAGGNEAEARAKALAQLKSAYSSVLSQFAHGCGSTLPAASSSAAAAPKKGGRDWSSALSGYVTHPERHADAVVAFDSDTVVIKDAYPKARRHYLVMPRQAGGADNVAALSAAHLPMLEKMKAMADKAMAADPALEFRVGFHSVPSMRHLHMHVISSDFDSAAIKTKKHWNSFTTAFFIPYEKVVEALRSVGRVHVDAAAAEALLSGPLVCHRCSHHARTIPDLKQHIATHNK